MVGRNGLAKPVTILRKKPWVQGGGKRISMYWTFRQRKWVSLISPFFLGVLYHMKHPLLALERVSSVTKKMLILETAVDALWSRRPAMAFYPGSEVGGAIRPTGVGPIQQRSLAC